MGREFQTRWIRGGVVMAKNWIPWLPSQRHKNCPWAVVSTVDGRFNYAVVCKTLNDAKKHFNGEVIVPVDLTMVSIPFRE
jgi:hypothetical protein